MTSFPVTSSDVNIISPVDAPTVSTFHKTWPLHVIAKFYETRISLYRWMLYTLNYGESITNTPQYLQQQIVVKLELHDLYWSRK